MGTALLAAGMLTVALLLWAWLAESFETCSHQGARPTERRIAQRDRRQANGLPPRDSTGSIIERRSGNDRRSSSAR
jgi:hypothetical protein